MAWVSCHIHRYLWLTGGEPAHLTMPVLVILVISGARARHSCRWLQQCDVDRIKCSANPNGDTGKMQGQLGLGLAPGDMQ